MSNRDVYLTSASRTESVYIERPYGCKLCRRRYGTLSALSLHVRIKHEQVVRLMMGLGPRDEVVSLHGRSVGAHMNDTLKDTYIAPRFSLSEALAIQGLAHPE